MRRLFPIRFQSTCFVALYAMNGFFARGDLFASELGVADAPRPPVMAGFEAGEYELGSIHGQRGWAVEQGVAEVVEEPSFRGKRHLRLAPAKPFSQARLKLAAAVPPAASTWVDCWVRPVAVPASLDAELLDVDGARVGFFRSPEVKEEGQFFVCDAEGATLLKTVTASDTSHTRWKWKEYYDQNKFKWQGW